ncbi:MAG: hypothetical protein M3083_25100 [Actinomycetota bacterium]|nr:hypothetical protein [Actinomycetota bacterium]
MTADLPVVLDVAQLEALLSKTFNIGLDVGRGKESVALVRLRLSKAKRRAWRCTRGRSTASPIRSFI